MARKPRVQYPGAFYHIIVRGNQRQNIFLDDADRLEYIKRLKRYKQKCGFVLYACKTTEQQIVGDERFIDRVDRELKREEKLLRKITIKEIEQSVKEITGFGLSEMNSSKRSKELRIARGVLVAIAKRAGFSLTELQSVIGRDISVLSRMSANAETDKGQKILEKVIARLNA
ncbi:MAG: transposase [Bacillota bacterium]